VVCRIAFTGANYRYSFDGLTLDIMTYLFVPPGEYAFTVNGNGFVRGLSLAHHFPTADLLPVRIDHIIENNPTNSLRVDFTLYRPTRVCFRITFYGPNVAGEIGLFSIVPSAGRAASERAGLYGVSKVVHLALARRRRRKMSPGNKCLALDNCTRYTWYPCPSDLIIVPIR